MPATAKRKKTADMPDSPPKRVTRARAKATDEMESKTKTVKIMTPSAKAALRGVKTAKANTVTKRKLRADEGHEDPTEDPQDDPATKEAPKARGRSKKVAPTSEETVKDIDAPKKTRGRQPKTTTSDEVKIEAPKLRTRAKKPQDAVEGNGDSMELEKAPIVKKTTRTRATAAVASDTIKPLRSQAPKKQVKFQDVASLDKENLPVELEKSAPKATGLRAKPIRKPATKAASRGRKAAVPKAEPKVGLQESTVLPLSPKKVNQVAKSSSIGSEDELCSEKTPIRALSQSPVKPPLSSVRRFDDVGSRLDFSVTASPSSPIKIATSCVLQSPARRPPASPFKDALRQSPKKGNLGDPFIQPVLLSSKSPSKSTIKNSPKRGLAPFSLKPNALSNTPLKASLLQSPARRPGVSPTRNTNIVSPSKASGHQTCESNVSPPSSPQEACSSPLRAVRTPGQSSKVHTISEASDGLEPDSASPDPLYPEHVASVAKESTFFAKSPSGAIRDAEENAIGVAQNDGVGVSGHPDEDIQMAMDESTVEPDEANVGKALDPAAFVLPAFSLASPQLRAYADESESEDELASPQKMILKTPLSREEASTKGSAVQIANVALQSHKRATPKSRLNRQSVAVTPLAAQLSAWLASSPEKKLPEYDSELGQTMSSPATMSVHESPPKSSFFEDEMAVLDPNIPDETPVDFQTEDHEHDQMHVDNLQASQVSEEYGDENAMPVDPRLVSREGQTQNVIATCTPAKVFSTQPREIHTVSKVPLRPAADDSPSPLKVPRKRSKSLAGSIYRAPGFQRVYPSSVVALPSNNTDLTLEGSTGQSNCDTPFKHRSNNDDSLIETPRTLRKNSVSNVLKGAVVYVDVHTTEGEDASGIFLELLSQMGARCLKQWSWNPRASLAATTHSTNNSDNENAETEGPGNKIGITHVVYKDGGKRTMEKVRASKGVVHCVGVGWVLDCEREDKWLDEAEYTIDTSLIPRGGHRRRKSMEPRMLANLNGNLIPTQTPKKAPEMSPTKEFLTFDTPASRRESFAVEQPAPATPTVHDTGAMLDDSPLSPTTPYYLSRGAQLVQQTCPPKQTQELLFPVSGRIDDQPDEGVRQRLLMARRKSLQFVPKISSPLGRAVSYGK